MDPFDPNTMHHHKIKAVYQVVHIVLEVEDENGEEQQIIVASNRRPVPVPYTEEP